MLFFSQSLYIIPYSALVRTISSEMVFLLVNKSLGRLSARPIELSDLAGISKFCNLFYLPVFFTVFFKHIDDILTYFLLFFSMCHTNISLGEMLANS